MPQPTDLVTDLPADFEVFGQAVATSMADLLGGTTDQVLAKNSNTDMDFKWVTSDDANAIQNTIVDAKGDLIAATAADTPARLAVGANNTMLVADSTASTGLAYKSAATLYAYTTWTPTLGSLTIGNGTVAARFAKIGKTVNFNLIISLGSTSSVTGRITFTLPSTANQLTNFSGMYSLGGSDYGANIFHTGGTVYCDAVNASGTYATTTVTSATVPFTWGANTFVFVNGTYEETA
jgi:hypothetical protein